LIHSAFWGQSFVAELNRISEHGERKLKLRRESIAASSPPPPPVHGAMRYESRESAANNRNIDGDRWVDGVEGGVDGTPDGMSGGWQNGTPDGVQDGVNGAMNGSARED
jgi:hypothetical protein